MNPTPATQNPEYAKLFHLRILDLRILKSRLLPEKVRVQVHGPLRDKRCVYIYIFRSIRVLLSLRTNAIHGTMSEIPARDTDPIALPMLPKSGPTKGFGLRRAATEVN